MAQNQAAAPLAPVAPAPASAPIPAEDRPFVIRTGAVIVLEDGGAAARITVKPGTPETPVPESVKALVPDAVAVPAVARTLCLSGARYADAAVRAAMLAKAGKGRPVKFPSVESVHALKRHEVTSLYVAAGVLTAPAARAFADRRYPLDGSTPTVASAADAAAAGAMVEWIKTLPAGFAITLASDPAAVGESIA